MTVGANRIVRGIAIPHPVGAPDEKPEAELQIRKDLLKKALLALSAEISEQTIF